ncbi:MAG TPA: TPM domain-containing protein, partial [Archangium sp.]|nr:TPM domain-containing protein [Archangium sp.]
MVKTSALVLLLPALLLGSTPVIDRPVVDERGLLSSSEKEDVARELVRLRDETGTQMAMLLVGSTGGEPIEDYAMRTAEAWRGGTAGLDNGLLFVLAVDDRRARLEVGYGMEE